MPPKAVFLAACCFVAFIGTAVAHHSGAAYDHSRLQNVEGTVKQVNWTNPHISFVIEIDAKDGAQPGTLAFEASSPGVLSRSGWTKRSLQVGDHATFHYSPLRDGRPGGYLVSVTLQSGEELRYSMTPDGQ